MTSATVCRAVRSAASASSSDAADADLLLVGHRGLGDVASACLGSVGLQCVLHATCPLTVVRPVAGSNPDEMPAAPTAMGMPTV
jgi:nucleotide-binding universal stress UspA family protein